MLVAGLNDWTADPPSETAAWAVYPWPPFSSERPRAFRLDAFLTLWLIRRADLNSHTGTPNQTPSSTRRSAPARDRRWIAPMSFDCRGLIERDWLAKRRRLWELVERQQAASSLLVGSRVARISVLSWAMCQLEGERVRRVRLKFVVTKCVRQVEALGRNGLPTAETVGRRARRRQVFGYSVTTQGLRPGIRSSVPFAVPATGMSAADWSSSPRYEPWRELYARGLPSPSA
jgi:hypothetical protein